MLNIGTHYWVLQAGMQSCGLVQFHHAPELCVGLVSGNNRFAPVPWIIAAGSWKGSGVQASGLGDAVLWVRPASPDPSVGDVMQASPHGGWDTSR